MNANIRASVDLIDRIFPKGVLNRNDKNNDENRRTDKKGG